MRPRRICSSYSDFLFFCRLFLFQLLKRGYDYSNLRKCINMVSKLKRLDLIKYKVGPCNDHLLFEIIRTK